MSPRSKGVPLPSSAATSPTHAAALQRQLMTSPVPNGPHSFMGPPPAWLVSPPSPLPQALSPQEVPTHPAGPSTGLSCDASLSIPDLLFLLDPPSIFTSRRVSPADHERAEGRHCQQGPLVMSQRGILQALNSQSQHLLSTHPMPDTTHMLYRY